MRFLCRGLRRGSTLSSSSRYTSLSLNPSPLPVKLVAPPSWKEVYQKIQNAKIEDPYPWIPVKANHEIESNDNLKFLLLVYYIVSNNATEKNCSQAMKEFVSESMNPSKFQVQRQFFILFVDPSSLLSNQNSCSFFILSTA